MTLIPRREIDFLLFDWLDAEALLADARFAEHSRETLDGLNDLSEKLAADAFLTHYKAADAAEPRLEDGQVRILPAIREALARYAELGLFAAGFAPEHGGLGLPYLATTASFVQFMAANLATAAYPMLTAANARLITSFGTPAQIEAFARPQIEGRWFGTMCLSEPQAGSSLADVATRAVPDGEDDLGRRFRLAGNKMWISGGDQDASENIVHLVLAKVPGPDGRLPEGTRGISLFIVPKWLPDGSRNDIAVAGLNHKMGYRGTANCLLNLGENGGALGWLVGAAGDGLRQMFRMMNEARIGVGLGAAAAGYRGTALAAAYAKERTQGRPIDRRDGPPVPLIAHPDVRRMLLQAKAYAEGALALCFYAARLVDTEADVPADAALLGLLTPIVKSWPAEFALAANDIAIQVHGGYGYTRDFDVEQLYRDNRLNPIHEGTTGIQAIDLVGRKILRDDGAGLAALHARIAATQARAAAWPDLAEALGAAWARIDAAIEELRDIAAPSPLPLAGGAASRSEAGWKRPSPKPTPPAGAGTPPAGGRGEGAAAFDNATPFLRAFGHGVVAWLWLDMALAAGDGEDPFATAKRTACRFFFETELPLIEAWLAPVTARSAVAAEAAAVIF